MPTRLNAANNAHSTLTSGINDSAESLVVASAASFVGPDGEPLAAPFIVKVGDEIILVTERSGSSTTFAGLERGYEGTTAASHSSGAKVENVHTAGTYERGVVRLDDVRNFAATAALVLDDAQTVDRYTAEGSVFQVPIADASAPDGVDGDSVLFGLRSRVLEPGMEVRPEKGYVTLPAAVQHPNRLLDVWLEVRSEAGGILSRTRVVVEVSANADLSEPHTVIPLEALGLTTMSAWTLLTVPLNSPTVRSYGIHHLDGHGTSGNTGFNYFMHVSSRPATGALGTAMAEEDASVLAPASYEAGVFGEAALTPSTSVDLRRGLATISQFRGKHSIRDWHVETDSEEDLHPLLSTIFASLRPGDWLEMDPRLQGRLSDKPLEIKGLRNVDIDWQHCRFYTNERRENRWFMLRDCRGVRMHNAPALFDGNGNLTVNGSAMQNVAGSPSTEGTTKELTAEDEEVRMAPWGTARQRDYKVHFEVSLSDSAQVENDCEILIVGTFAAGYNYAPWENESTVLARRVVTLTGTQATYEIDTYLTDLRHDCSVHVRKVTDTANTITVHSATRRGHNQHFGTWEFSTGWEIGKECMDIEMEGGLCEGLGGGAIIFEDPDHSDESAHGVHPCRNITVRNWIARCCNRQGYEYGDLDGVEMDRCDVYFVGHIGAHNIEPLTHRRVANLDIHDGVVWIPRSQYFLVVSGTNGNPGEGAPAKFRIKMSRMRVFTSFAQHNAAFFANGGEECELTDISAPWGRTDTTLYSLDVGWNKSSITNCFLGSAFFNVTGNDNNIEARLELNDNYPHRLIRDSGARNNYDLTVVTKNPATFAANAGRTLLPMGVADFTDATNPRFRINYTGITGLFPETFPAPFASPQWHPAGLDLFDRPVKNVASISTDEVTGANLAGRFTVTETETEADIAFPAQDYSNFSSFALASIHRHDGTLTPGATYHYRIAARNRNGPLVPLANQSIALEESTKVETTTAGNTLAGSATILVASTTGLRSGDGIIIDPGGAKEEETSITEIISGAIRVSPVTVNQHDTGTDIERPAGDNAVRISMAGVHNTGAGRVIEGATIYRGAADGNYPDRYDVVRPADGISWGWATSAGSSGVDGFFYDEGNAIHRSPLRAYGFPVATRNDPHEGPGTDTLVDETGWEPDANYTLSILLNWDAHGWVEDADIKRSGFKVKASAQAPANAGGHYQMIRVPE